MKKTVTFLTILILAAGAQAACYTVLGPKGNVLSESSTPPVDMSYQLHQTVPYAYGQGATMVFGIADPRCGDELDRYYDLKTAQVVYEAPRKGSKQQRRHARAARHDRE
ncbi:hypothetical protein FVQ98_15875 [Ottowia sp. GY511]|uniref:Uncharacterized protein n=1 Tax=Ottowia flava TaxID=2675430 RepID=A0ABW4KRR8_9BURK|nr:hypothetical protein [Ottowia sp. GY511]TXK24906.1 hypothetical protein FVQ98_15875 [Ottowia sp. GY511]